MKIFHFAIIFLLSIISCISNHEDKKKDTQNILESNEIPNSKNYKKDTDFIENGTYNVIEYYKNRHFNYDTILVDTFIGESYILYFNSIDSTEYFSTLENYYQDLNIPKIEMYIQEVESFEEIKLKQDTLISLRDSCFIIDAVDSTIIFRKNSDSKGLSDYSKSIYKGYISEMKLFIFWNEVHEGGSFYAFNENTKSKTFFWGYPKLSPNKKMILSSYYDIEFQFYNNGFELFSFKNDTIEKVFQYSPKALDWGPEGMIWKNDSTLYFIRMTWDKSGYYLDRYLQSVKFRKIANH